MEARENDQVSTFQRPKNRLPGGPFYQQELPAWQPIINFRTIWKWLVGFGAVCILIGIGLLVIFWNQSKEIRIEYTPQGDCIGATNCANRLKVRKGKCASCVPKSADDCICSTEFKVEEDFKKPLYLYYELENFHQNHRSYVKSRDDYQMLGRILKEPNLEPIAPDSACHPFAKDDRGKYYFPCGAIANSMFSDKFSIKKENQEMVKLQTEGISWPSEKINRFKNPNGINKKNYNTMSSPKVMAFQNNFTRPKDWSESTYDDWWSNGGLENEHFMNWMRPASTPTFRKLYAIIDTKCKPGVALCKGSYTLSIIYRYDVDRFNGKKSVILSTTSILGARNTFLGWFIATIGVVCCIIGGTFFILNKRLNHRVHPDHRRMSLNQGNANPTPSTSVSEGKKTL